MISSGRFGDPYGRAGDRCRRLSVPYPRDSRIIRETWHVCNTYLMIVCIYILTWYSESNKPAIAILLNHVFCNCIAFANRAEHTFHFCLILFFCYSSGKLKHKNIFFMCLFYFFKEDPSSLY